MIFQFSDYRSFLKDYLKRLPKNGFGEAKKMAEHLRVSSTYISHVLSGAKELSLEQATSLGKYLGLSDLEADYFFYLVQFERAGSAELKSFCTLKLQDLKKRSLKLVDRVEAKKILDENEKAIFYSSPLYSSIHIFCATGKKGKTLDEIARRFDIPRAKATSILSFLVEAGLCLENENLFLTGTMGTHLEQGSAHILKHHANWRLRAIQAAESLDEKELMYTVNVALSERDFSLLREEMVGFIKLFLDKVYPSPSEEIATFNLDWFWIRK